jgi:hypothetical protein
MTTRYAVFGLLCRRDTLQEDTMAVEHAVITTYRLGSDGFGTAEDRKTVRATEARLRDIVKEAGVGELDGNEFGAGTVSLYAYGPDADALFRTMEPMLRELPFRPADVVLRYGEATDPSAREAHISL